MLCLSRGERDYEEEEEEEEEDMDGRKWEDVTQ